MIRTLSLALALMLPAAARAHPHIFIDTTMSVVVDAEGRVTGVRMSWLYDDFFSYMLTADLGIDPEGDLILTPDETATLQASVLDWPADYTGDLMVQHGGDVAGLAPRAEGAVVFDQGRIRESHLRPLAAPALATPENPVIVQNFDPTYYVAYTVIGPVTVEGRPDCTAELIPANLNVAQALVDDLLGGRAASDVGPTEAFPEVGQAFSDTVRVTCPA